MNVVVRQNMVSQEKMARLIQKMCENIKGHHVGVFSLPNREIYHKCVLLFLYLQKDNQNNLYESLIRNAK